MPSFELEANLVDCEATERKRRRPSFVGVRLVDIFNIKTETFLFGSAGFIRIAYVGMELKAYGKLEGSGTVVIVKESVFLIPTL